MAVLLTPPVMQFVDADGVPLSGGKIYTYSAGTTTPKASYTDAGAGTPNSNPVILDSSGRAVIFIDGSYRVDIYTSSDALVRSVDNITSYSVVSAAGQDLLNASTASAQRAVLGFTNSIIQIVESGSTAQTTGTTVLPSDTSIPQNTEGDQYLSATITPSSATNRLLIEVIAFVSHSVADCVVTGAIFNDSTASAICAGLHYCNAAKMLPIIIRHEMAAGTTSATTFNVRIGGGVAGTTYFNRNSTGNIIGGVLRSSIRITEIAS